MRLIVKMHNYLIKWLSEIKKKIEKGVPHMVTHRRRCLNYSKAYSVPTERLLLAWSQNEHITYYIHIPYTITEISIDPPYNSADLLPENKHN